MACACFLFVGFLSEAQAPLHHTPEGFRNNYQVRSDLRAPRILAQKRTEAGLSADDFDVMKIGETRNITRGGSKP